MDGLEFLKQYHHWRKTNKTDEWATLNRNMLVIVNSSTANEKEQICAFKHGMHAFSPKPIDYKM